MNLRLTTLVLALLAAAPAARAAVTVQERSEQAEAPQGLRELTVENAHGWVHLRPSSDGRLHVSALKICRAESNARARQYALETRVQAGREGDQFVVRVAYPRKIDVRISFWDLFKEESWSEGGLMPRSEVHLVLDVPPGLAARVTCTSGDVNAEALTTPLAVRTSSGDVSVRLARGPVDVVTSSGDVEASDVAAVSVSTSSGDQFFNGALGPLHARSSSGEITVNGARDTIQLRTSSGDVTVDDSPRYLALETSSGEAGVRSAAGHVHVSTASGGIQLRLRGPLITANLSAGSGDVHVALVPGMDASLDARSSSGEIDSQLPLQGVRSERGTLAGRVGRGGPVVKIETASGDITLTGGGK